MPFLEDQELSNEVYLPVTSDVVDGYGIPLSDPEESVGAEEEIGLPAVTFEDAGPEIVDDDHGEEPEAVAAPVDDMDEDEPTSMVPPKRRGRTATATPAKSTGSRTPRTAKSAKASASTGRKRKSTAPDVEVDEQDGDGVLAKRGRKRKSEHIESKEEATPAKRGRPSRPAAKSARLSGKETSKPKRGPPAGSAVSNKAATTKTTKGKPGRPKKSDGINSTAVSTKEYEVEKIIETMVDGPSKEHMYRVKWKGYPESQNTWEPKSNLTHATELIKEFDEANKKTAKVTPAKETVVKERKKPGRKPGPKPASKPGRKPGRKPAGRPAGKPGRKAGRKAKA